VPTGELSVWPAFKTGKASAQSIGVNWLAPILDPTLIVRSHRKGQQVWVWTVDRAWQQRLMLWLGVDGITTNNPAQAISRLN
jgi:glycerophosphoryl diester phosphodiesterase